MNKKILFNNVLLDKYQTKAVLCKKPVYLVVAGAGSGKTLTILAKVDYLLKNGYKSKDILCISFTNETVNELKKRLEKNNMFVNVKTFHRLSLDIIGRKYNICSSDLLEYIIDEYFYSFIYFDNSYKLLKYIDNIKYLKNTILLFINQLKSLNLGIDYILLLLKNNLISSDDKIILIFIFKIYVIYQEELDSENKIDFNDMINIACNKVDDLKYFNYSYIIIDEYQDTSYTKYLLIKNLINKFNINLMAVGDDYQSIYSFTGCDLKLFTKFKKYFKNSKIIKMNINYRNPFDIVEISKRFVLQNRSQIYKKLYSNKYIKDSLEIVYSNNIEKAFLKVIDNIDNILVIGRNNKDLDIAKNIRVEKNIRYMTVHSSKGLEEDYVIILNVIEDTLGFPNKIKENNVLSYLQNYNHLEEERRLFFVALTRAKKKVFIFTKTGKESIFVKELIKKFKHKIKIVNLD